MAKPTGFIEYDREPLSKRPKEERISDFDEIEQLLPYEKLEIQAARCMDCGIPHCHAFGCPLANRIPEWNDLVYRQKWQKALELLHSTNNLPEITGRICPATCEAACSLAIDESSVIIRSIELQLVERGWKAGWIKPELSNCKTDKKVAVVGSGPAGLAAAQQLIRNGHDVVVFEKSDKVGGIMRYGIPDFKLEKWVLDRRLEQMVAEGVVFESDVNVGEDVSFHYLRRFFDAILLATGSSVPRDLPIPGRKLKNIYFAMDFLVQQNKINAGIDFSENERISAKDKNVIVIGGGDTGSDCVGTCRRQGAANIVQIELLPKPPVARRPDNPWPTWPLILRTSSSHEEGCERLWSIMTKEFVSSSNSVEKIRFVKLEWSGPDMSGQSKFTEISDSEFELKADLVLLAMGFVGPQKEGLLSSIGAELDSRKNVRTDENYMTSVPGVFSAGDMHRGQSLIVWAISEGREAANGVNQYLKGCD